MIATTSNDLPMQEQLTIIIISYNSGEIISRCLGQLINSHRYPVIIVDNCSSDGSGKALEQKFNHQKTTIKHLPVNIGYGRAANVGLSATSTPYALLLNPDLIATIEDVDKLLQRALAESDQTAIWGPATSLKEHEKDVSESVEWISGCAMLFDMKKLQHIGFFDENIFLFFEETDLCQRTINAGFGIKRCNMIHFNHLAGKSSSSNDAIEHLKDWHYGWSRSYYFNKHQCRNEKRTPEGMLKTYKRKALLALGRSKRAKYRAHAKGAKAFLNGEPAFLENGIPQEVARLALQDNG